MGAVFVFRRRHKRIFVRSRLEWIDGRKVSLSDVFRACFGPDSARGVRSDKVLS